MLEDFRNYWTKWYLPHLHHYHFLPGQTEKSHHHHHWNCHHHRLTKKRAVINYLKLRNKIKRRKGGEGGGGEEQDKLVPTSFSSKVIGWSMVYTLVYHLQKIQNMLWQPITLWQSPKTTLKIGPSIQKSNCCTWVEVCNWVPLRKNIST